MFIGFPIANRANIFPAQDFGYLRILVNSAQLHLEYHPASDGAEAKVWTFPDFVNPWPEAANKA
jgi:hypothetical protein